jgi:hypothetical protein
MGPDGGWMGCSTGAGWGPNGGPDGVPDGSRRSGRWEPCHRPRHF